VSDDDAGPSVRLGPNTVNSWLVGPAAVDLRRPARPEAAVTVPALPRRLTVDLARSAIVVVDMQNDFCHPDGWLAGIGVDISGARAPIPVLAELLPALRAAGVPVVWLNWGNRPDRANLPRPSRRERDGRGSVLPSGRPCVAWVPARRAGEHSPVGPAQWHGEYRVSRA
jgi:hypothetical protein